MSLLQIVLAGILVLGPLIAIHEFGHFWVARRCGVKVLTFSIGFGPALWKRVARDGTEYRLAAIPLGGFVRMLDEREGEVAPEDLPHAFNRQSVWARMAIVAAGPLINLLFAWLLYVVLFMQPGTSLSPVIGSVQAGSAAASAGIHAGDELVAIGERAVDDWESANYALLDHLGETGIITVSVLPEGASLPQTRFVGLSRYLLDQQAEDPFRALGMVPWMPALPAVIGQVEAGSAADRAGLRAGDRVLAIDGVAMTEWRAVVDRIVASPGRGMRWMLQRDGRELALTVVPDSEKTLEGRRIGRLGVAVKADGVVIPPAYQRDRQRSLGDAMMAAADKTSQLIRLTLTSLGKMVTGLIGMDSLSGPITIVKVAGQSASLGWEALIGFMALLSVSLGVLNLLPVPVLDGGHLLFFAIEAARRRPLPESVQLLGLRVGVALMGSVMLLAILNDIRRLF